MDQMNNDDEKDSNVTPEEIDEAARAKAARALKSVIEALGNSAEAMALEREEEAAAASGSEVDYEADMAIDAKDIAKFLAEKMARAAGQSIEVVLHNLTTGEQATGTANVPEPTLESLRDQAKKVAESFASVLTEVRRYQTKDREEGACSTTWRRRSAIARCGKPTAEISPQRPAPVESGAGGAATPNCSPRTTPSMEKRNRFPETYLSDGAYAEMRDGRIRLYTNDGLTTTNEVFLDPEVWLALTRFAEQNGWLGKDA